MSFLRAEVVSSPSLSSTYLAEKRREMLVEDKGQRVEGEEGRSHNVLQRHLVSSSLHFPNKNRPSPAKKESLCLVGAPSNTGRLMPM